MKTRNTRKTLFDCAAAFMVAALLWLVRWDDRRLGEGEYECIA